MKKRYFKVCVSELALPYRFEELTEVDFTSGIFYAPDVVDLCEKHPDKTFYFDKCVILEEKKEAGDLFDLIVKDESNLVLNSSLVIDAGLRD